MAERVSLDSLRPGDVVVFGPGDTRVVHHVELTPTMRFGRVGWASGESSVVDRQTPWTRLSAAPPSAQARARERAAAPPTPPQEQDPQ